MQSPSQPSAFNPPEQPMRPVAQPSILPPSPPPSPPPRQEGKDAKQEAKSDEKQPDEMITTGVDDLIRLLNDYPKLSVDEVSRRLNVSKAILKSWIDFLVEEKILGIEYSFTTPYIYVNKAQVIEKPKKITEIRLSYAIFKQEYYEKARADRIPEDKIAGFWQTHLQNILAGNKEFFMREVKKRNLPKGEELWQRYTAGALGA